MSCGWIAGARQCQLIQELMISFMLIQFLASIKIGIAFFHSLRKREKFYSSLNFLFHEVDL